MIISVTFLSANALTYSRRYRMKRLSVGSKHIAKHEWCTSSRQGEKKKKKERKNERLCQEYETIRGVCHDFASKV